MPRKILRHEAKDMDLNELSDLLTIMAGNIEDALIASGVPESEYTAMKCFELAMPFALDLYRKKDKGTFTAGWPDTSGD